jgi:unsaturated rhamnogalacturonyl hydrolase
MNKRIITVLIFSIVCSVSFSQTKTITLDYYFNHEFKKTKEGSLERFHYTWEDTANSGYSKWGTIFKQKGFELKSLEVAPTINNLQGTSVYLIVDPDTEKETAKPNYIESNDLNVISDFVRNGGVLVIMANDSLNVEFDHLNKLTEVFGIHLNGDSKSKVFKDNFEMAAFMISNNDPIFTTAHKVYLKEVSSLTLNKKAEPILKHQTEKYIVAAKVAFGKGTVVVIGDPWFYNEYLNGRLGNDNGWDNIKAAEDFTTWLYKISKIK